MKKKIAILMAVVLLVSTLFALTGCSKKAATDLDYVKEKGTLIVGITDFKPFDYQDKDGSWIGFDADMATKFAETLGVKVQFQIVDWDNKLMELNNKTVDCIWNAMTLTDEVKTSMECSKPYCNNSQVTVFKAADIAKYQKVEDCKDLTFAVESGSAGQEQAEANGFKFTAVKDQAKALMEVKSGTSDGAIIDKLMAAAMTGEGTDYADLGYSISLNDEEYGVGFRQGSNIAAELDKFFDACVADGTTKTLAEKYDVLAAVIL